MVSLVGGGGRMGRQVGVPDAAMRLWRRVDLTERIDPHEA